MKLLTAELRATIPPLYSQERLGDPIVHAKFFTPWTKWTWFATEGSEQDGVFLFFGCVIGSDEEWGYFQLEELESVTGPAGLKIERDLNFQPRPFSEVIARFRGTQ
jgi:hypothetical protein